MIAPASSLAGGPSRSIDSQTVDSFAARIENAAYEAARKTPYLTAPNTLAALQSVLIAVRAIRNEEGAANQLLADIGRRKRATLDEIEFRLQQLERALDRTKFGSGPRGELDFDVSTLEEAAWYLGLRANDILPETALVLSVDTTADRGADKGRILVRTRGVRSLEVVEEERRTPCKNTEEDVFRCPAASSDADIEEVTIRDWELLAQVPSWRLLDSIEKPFQIPLIVLPDWAARYQVRFDVTAVGAQPEFRTADFAVWSESNLERWTTELKCASATPNWSIDPQSVQLVHQWGKNGRVDGIENVTREGFCVRLSARGQGFLKGRGRQNVVIEYLEIPKEREPVALEPVVGKVGYGDERTIRFPAGVAAVAFQLELPDGRRIEGFESKNLPGVNIEVLRDRVVIHGTQQPNF